MKHDQKYYMKKCAQMLEEIRFCPRDNGVRFLLLKKKAKKYLEKAKELEKIRPIS